MSVIEFNMIQIKFKINKFQTMLLRNLFVKLICL